MENEAVELTHRELAEPLTAAIGVLNLATKLQANDKPVGRLAKTEIVRLLLLQRLQNDLRCCILLVERVYPLQAASIAAGIFEAWVTIANIKTEDDAVQWLSHSKENESFGRIRPLIKKLLENIGGDANQIDKLYSQYQQLCLAKHLNPIIERTRGYSLDGTTIEFHPGPDIGESAVRYGWYAIERATRFAHLALFTFAHSQDTPQDLHFELITQQCALNELQAKSAQRWPRNYFSEEP